MSTSSMFQRLNSGDGGFLENAYSSEAAQKQAKIYSQRQIGAVQSSAKQMLSEKIGEAQVEALVGSASVAYPYLNRAYNTPGGLRGAAGEAKESFMSNVNNIREGASLKAQDFQNQLRGKAQDVQDAVDNLRGKAQDAANDLRGKAQDAVGKVQQSREEIQAFKIPVREPGKLLGGGFQNTNIKLLDESKFDTRTGRSMSRGARTELPDIGSVEDIPELSANISGGQGLKAIFGQDRAMTERLGPWQQTGGLTTPRQEPITQTKVITQEGKLRTVPKSQIDESKADLPSFDEVRGARAIEKPKPIPSVPEGSARASSMSKVQPVGGYSRGSYRIPSTPSTELEPVKAPVPEPVKAPEPEPLPEPEPVRTLEPIVKAPGKQRAVQRNVPEFEPDDESGAGPDRGPEEPEQEPEPEVSTESPSLKAVQEKAQPVQSAEIPSAKEDIVKAGEDIAEKTGEEEAIASAVPGVGELAIAAIGIGQLVSGEVQKHKEKMKEESEASHQVNSQSPSIAIDSATSFDSTFR